MDEDLGRYESAVGWKAADPYKKQRERIQKQEEMEERLASPILQSPSGASAKKPEELFTTLWRTGEVALFFGAPGVGKSIFAVHLAEAIGNADALVRNERSELPQSSARRVVYIDLQRTESQFDQRFPNATIERRLTEWDREPVPPRAARRAGARSLVLWAIVVFAGRMIAYNWFDCDKQPQPPIVNALAGCVARPR